MTSVSDVGPVNTNVPCPWIPASGPVPAPTVITWLCQLSPVRLPSPRYPERAAPIAQNLVEGKAKVTVGRNALAQVAFDDAGHDRAVCQADVVQAGEVELDERLRAGLPHLKVRLAGELDRPVAALGRRAVVVTATAITASDVYRNICFIGVVLCIFVFMLFNFLSL